MEQKFGNRVRFSRIAVYGRDIQSSSRTVWPRKLNDMREMSLAEFGWKLCATTAFCFVVAFILSVSMVFVPDTLGLQKPVAIVFFVSRFVVPAAAVLAIAGHVWKYWRSRPANPD